MIKSKYFSYSYYLKFLKRKIKKLLSNTKLCLQENKKFNCDD